MPGPISRIAPPLARWRGIRPGRALIRATARGAAAALALAWAAAATAQGWLDQPADPGRLAPAEIRFLEAALAVDGRFAGRIDGHWGAPSAAALAQTVQDRFGHRAPTLRDLALLAAPFRTALAGGQWAPYSPDRAALSLLMPRAVLGPVPRSDETVFADAKGHLVLRIRGDDLTGALSLHRWLAENALTPGSVPIPEPGPRMRSQAVLRDRTFTMHVLSLRDGDRYLSVILHWAPQRAPEARLMLASLRAGGQAPLTLPEDGVLARAIAALAAPAGTPGSGDALPDGLRLIGSGFYVNNTDLVTGHALLRACRVPRLADGTPLRRVAAARNQGLAVLTGPARARHWLGFGGATDPEPGAALSATGYAAAGPRLQRQRPEGRAEGEMLTGEDGLRVLVSIPDGGTLAGAPVQHRSGALAGVFLGRAGDPAGSFSQIAPVSRLVAVLERGAILFDRGETAGPVEAAAVALFCQE